MAFGTNLNFYIFLGATSFYYIATSAGDGSLIVFGMYFIFHGAITFLPFRPVSYKIQSTQDILAQVSVAGQAALNPCL